MLGLLRCDEEKTDAEEGGGSKDKTVWLYSLDIAFDHKTLRAMAGGGRIGEDKPSIPNFFSRP